MGTIGWQPVRDTLHTGLGGLYHRLHHVKNSHDFRMIASEALVQGDPLVSATAAALLLSVIVWALSLPTNKHSWVDKLWSLLPIYYMWHFASHSKTTGVNPRLFIMAVITTVWGVRLTYNFWRKGGYRWSEEDYRWPIIRKQVHPALFQVFSLVFIAFIQNILLLAITAPAYVAWQWRGTPLNWLDALASLLVLALIWLETAADQQQWNFQTAKHAKIAAGKRLTGDFHKGFLTGGLFKYSRHPNFFAEQAIWWSVYLFSVAASGAWVNWSAAGALALTALFQGSTWLTEKLTVEKYPKYREYQQTTSRLIPWWPFTPKKRARARRTQQQEEDVSEETAPQTPVTPRRRGRMSIGASPEAKAPTPAPPAADTPATTTRSRRKEAMAPAAAGQGESEGAGRATPRTRRSGRAAAEGATPRRKARSE